MRDLVRSSFITASVFYWTSTYGALAQVVAPPGYIYTPLELQVDTQNCIAATSVGTFVGIGRGFTANGQSIGLVGESGALKLVAFGFSSLGDCVYDPDTDTLYVTDNADNADLGITTSFGNTAAQSGDTVYAIAGASTASGVIASDVELLPADSIEFASNLALDAAGTVYVGDAAGGGSGAVQTISLPGPVSNTFASGFDLTGGLAVDPASGDVFVSETRSGTFDTQIRRFDSAGTPIAPDPFSGPGFTFGSFDLAMNADGDLIASGAFAGDVTLVSSFDGSTSPFVTGLTFASGVSVHPTTQRVDILSSTFSGAAEDRTLHRFVSVDTLIAGRGSPTKECLHEFYGVELDPGSTNTASCTDGDSCDADATENGRCDFRIGSCFNVDDPDLAECDATDSIAALSTKTKPYSPSLDDLFQRSAAALPIGDAQCFLGDGFIVPVRTTRSGTKDGKAKLRVRAESSDGRKDTDSIKLVCRPAP